MIERYTRPEMGRIWTLENKYRKWLDVELAVCEALFERGEVPPEDYKTIKEKAGFDVKRIEEIERETQHDVIAFLTSVAEFVGPSSRFIHEGLTSSDVLDTAFGLLLTEASGILLEDIEKLLSALKRRAFEFKNTVQIGRSHNVHAEPITFGLKLAVWHSEMARNRDRLLQAREGIRVGKISGAVGTFANTAPEIEEAVCVAPWTETRFSQHADHPAGPARAVFLDSCHNRMLHREDCNRDPPAPAHRDPGGRRVFFTQPEGVLRDAPQTQSDFFRKPLRPGARPSGQRPGRNGKRGAVARARHQPFISRTSYRSGLHNFAGLHADASHARCRPACRVCRTT